MCVCVCVVSAGGDNLQPVLVLYTGIREPNETFSEPSSFCFFFFLKHFCCEINIQKTFTELLKTKHLCNYSLKSQKENIASPPQPLSCLSISPKGIYCLGFHGVNFLIFPLVYLLRKYPQKTCSILLAFELYVIIHCSIVSGLVFHHYVSKMCLHCYLILESIL